MRTIDNFHENLSFVSATLWHKLVAKLLNKYGFLTEFEVHAVYYGPIFLRSDLWPKRERIKTRFRNLQHGQTKRG